MCDYLSDTIIDVSTLLLLCRRWYPNIYKSKEYNQPKDTPQVKSGLHRAMFDVEESIKVNYLIF